MERFGSVAGIGNGSRGAAPEGPSRIPTRFVWPHGGRWVFVSGSFAGWSFIIPMVPLENCPTVFQVVCNLKPGTYQYKFCVDGEWQHDEQQPFVTEDIGPVNTILVRQPYILPSISRAGIPSRSRMEVDHNVYGHLEAYPRMSESELHVSRRNISTFLSTHTAYELLPVSGKVIALDIDLPVNQAFNVLYEEGVSMAPVWDSSKCRFVGVLSVMDFIHILKELMSTGSNLTVEQLESHSLAAWSTYPWSFVDAGPHDCLKDVALKFLQNKVSAIPIIHSSSEGGLVPQLLHLACLPRVLKCICQHFKHTPGSLPILQLPIGSIPLGTWMPKLGDFNKQPLAILRPNAPLSAALSLLIQAEVSSIPIVDDNDSLLDIYSISDVIALVKNKAYARINLEEFSIHQALLLRKDANNSYDQKCYVCLRSDTLQHVMESLTDPGARRIVVVKAGSMRVEGIISIGDLFRFLLS